MEMVCHIPLHIPFLCMRCTVSSYKETVHITPYCIAIFNILWLSGDQKAIPYTNSEINTLFFQTNTAHYTIYCIERNLMGLNFDKLTPIYCNLMVKFAKV